LGNKRRSFGQGVLPIRTETELAILMEQSTKAAFQIMVRIANEEAAIRRSMSATAYEIRQSEVQKRRPHCFAE